MNSTDIALSLEFGRAMGLDVRENKDFAEVWLFDGPDDYCIFNVPNNPAIWGKLIGEYDLRIHRLVDDALTWAVSPNTHSSYVFTGAGSTPGHAVIACVIAILKGRKSEPN